MRCLEVADISCRFLYIKKRYLKLLSSKPWLLTPTWAAGFHSGPQEHSSQQLCSNVPLC